MIQKIRGTQDILYDQVKYWRLIVEQAKKILESADYLEIRTPIIEYTSLFTKTLGKDTDILSKEMYSFYDQAQRAVTLRPEGTASVVRALVENKLYNYNNIRRFWYVGSMFRYERPQSGRQRQFHQLGIECFGTRDPRADVEVIYLACKLLDQLKCNSFQLEINSIGTYNDRHKYQEELKNYLSPYLRDLDEDSKTRLRTNPLRILDTKNIKTQEILVHAPKLSNFLDSCSKKHFATVCQYLSYLDISYEINEKLVRGLDYYNNTAFEMKVDSLGLSTEKTICGGGRYDNLVRQLGGQEVPAVGWAIGVERLYNLLKNKVKFITSSVDVYVASQGEAANRYSLFIMRFLQARRLNVTLDLSNQSFRKQLKNADKASAKVCLIIGEREMLNKTVTIKWLNNGKQENFKQDLLHHYIQCLKNKIYSFY
uniref:histidine--tRNA ligase n=1 Tax=Hildenbrandia rivularis TaxID=135206 RepID=A0A1C9CFP6_9FLOR|nr:histidine-tRNA synthetase [Hildenbrandia rivularis]AOM67201.1 histidine-tRNA synthetase [Hildenbrandia rivularis]